MAVGVIVLRALAQIAGFLSPVDEVRKETAT
jgi:hypothetical protein